MTERADFRPSREVPFSAQLTGELPVATGLTRRLEIEELWAAGGIDLGIADVVDALPGLMVESALSRLDQGAPAEFDIDRELKLAPAAELAEEVVFEASFPAPRGVSAEDERVEVLDDEEVVNTARDEEAVANGEIDPDLWHDISDERANTE
ncbi:MAG: hypothetical protein ABSE17_02960 [Candidatus Levyibacteriota bacterium]|jgi:hypothetical protein